MKNGIRRMELSGILKMKKSRICHLAHIWDFDGNQVSLFGVAHENEDSGIYNQLAAENLGFVPYA